MFTPGASGFGVKRGDIVVGRTALRKWLRGFVGFPPLIVLTVAIIASAWASPTASAAGSTETVYHWGAFSIGLNSSDDELKVPTAMTLPGQIEEVATSNSAEYALLTNGTVYAWGGGQDGELGNGTTDNSFARPVQVKFPTGVVIRSLPTDAMPFNTALAVDEQGNAWGWGSNSYGQLCQGNKRKYLTPVEVPLSDVTSIAGAFDHALYDSDGTVYACGGNVNGDLGDGSTKASSIPVAVTGLGKGDVTGLYAAYSNSGALLSNGEYFDWGLNSGGQLGEGRSAKRSTVPVHISLRAQVTQVALGGSLSKNGQTLVELSDGTYWAWGTDSFGQLGNGSTADESSPIQIHAPRGVTYTILASGGETSYGVSSTGEVYAWGNGSTGQLGDGKRTNRQLTPVEVESGATQISSTAHNVAIF
jgi:alpha-tubulin suppressor-like RCC1 family protein